MKKLIAIFAVLLLAAPVMAADWSFYGSQRVATFYVAQDYGDYTVNGQDDDWGLQWDFQGNSRMGAKVKADKVSGHIELSLSATNGGDGGDGGVGTRLAYGAWKFADNASLKVGKMYSPVTRFISSQTFGSDAGALGAGDFYGRRPAGLALQIGEFELALLHNALNTTGLAPAGSDPDWNVPKVEAQYMLKLGSFDIRPFGGFQYFKVSDGVSALTDDIDVYSWVVGLDSMINIGAFYLGLQGTYGDNWSNANWSGSLVGGTSGSFARLNTQGDDTEDCTSYMGLVVAGLKFTDTLKFEVGAGYRMDDSEVNAVKKDDMWHIYGQATITMYPGVYLVPEVGYIDFLDDIVGNNEGYSWYAGAKWQIDF
jgi:predicted porin